MSFSFQAAGTAEAAREQIEAVKTEDELAGKVKELVLDQLEKWPTETSSWGSLPGVIVEASGHHDRQGCYLKLEMRMLYLPAKQEQV